VRDLAREAERTAHRSISLIHAAERDFTRGIDRLGHRLEAFVLRQVHGIDRLIRDHALPRLRVVEHDVAVTIPAELGRVDARLKRLEKLIGLGVIGALVFRILAKVAPWIFCRNVKKVANTVCGLNPNELNTLLGLLAGAFAIADIGTLASGVAQGQVNRTLAEVWARETGFGQDQFNALVDIANVGPGAAYAFEMWRRNVIGEQGFRRAVLRLGLEQEWIDDLVALKQVLLSPAELAVMVQRTVVPDPGLLPNQPDTAGSNVPPMPVVDIDVLAEAAAAGINPER